jgi:hypothetical protein
MINYTESFNFKPIPTITPASDYWQNSTWKFNMPEITVGTGVSPSWQDIILSGNTALTLVNAKEDGLNYLKLFGGTEQRNLPSGFTQVEYIESTGTQWIDTGYKPNNNTSIDIKFSTSSAQHFVFGSRKDTIGDDQQRFCLYATINKFNPQYGNTNYADADGFVTSTAYQVQMDKNGLVVDGITIRDFNSENFTGENNLILFGNNTNGTVVSAENRIYYSKISENGTMVRNLIPARRNSDNVLGMYDTITDTFFTNAGTGTFTAGADAVPSPDNPMDIVCNNGVVKVRHQSGLPLGYTLLDYIESSGTQYIDTGITDVTNSEFEVVAQQTSITGAFPTIMGAFDDDSNYKVVCGLSTSNNTFYSQLGGPQGFIVSSVPNDTQKHTFKVTTTTRQQTLQVDDTAVVTGNYAITSTTSYSLTICARNKSTVSNFTNQKVFSVRIKKSGVLVRNLIPAKNSSNVVGMYDTVSGQFFTNAGTGSFVAGQNINDLEIYADGTTETVEVTGKNLYNPATRTDGYYIGADGTIAQGSRTFCYSALILVKPNTNYMLSGTAGQTDNRRLHAYDSSGNWISQVSSANTTVGNTYNITGTTPNNCAYVRISIPMLDTNVQLEQGSSATAYEQYTVLGTATAEDLLKVGTYQDEQNVTTGDVTRNVGIKVLNGTEDWTRGQSFYCNTLTGVLQADHSCYCTHFQGIMNNSPVVVDSNTCRVGYHIDSDIAWDRLYIYADRSLYATAQDFANYLASQYANGTPVIVVYPISSPVTEQVAPQSLTIQEGTNIVEITQASIDNLGLEVSYKAGVVVTITEVQNAQLDNSVEVTIQ